MKIPYTEVRRSFDFPAPAWGFDKGDGSVFIRCKCGKCMGLQHEIDADGNVFPSVHHDEPDCGWHETVKLEGYAERKAAR